MPPDADSPTWSAEPYVPRRHALSVLREAVQSCHGCDLHRNATQAVFGEGLKRAHLMVVGEQPGDREDRQGRPFVGPAGAVLDEALEAVGIPRDDVFVTNAVKHFKFSMRGKRRLHAKPTHREVQACRPWLEAELDAVKPQLLVLMGSTAGQALMGRGFRVTQSRGEPFETPWCRWTFATVHPSSVLRVPDSGARRAAREGFIADFHAVARQWHQLDTVGDSRSPAR